MDKTGARAIEEQIIYAAIWAGATFEEAYKRITFESDTTYLGQEFQIQSVVAFINANKDTKLLSKQNAYAILEKTFPGVITNFEDNEEQLISDEDGQFSTPATNAILNALAGVGGGSNGNDEDEDENKSDGENGSEEKKKPE